MANIYPSTPLRMRSLEFRRVNTSADRTNVSIQQDEITNLVQHDYFILCRFQISALEDFLHRISYSSFEVVRLGLRGKQFELLALREVPESTPLREK